MSVIAILAVLGGVAVIVLNPQEQLKKARDARRLSDISTIHRALGYYEADRGSQSMGSSSVVYISLPDTDDASPAECDEYTLPSLPLGWTYACALRSILRKTDATGWIPVNFKAMSIGSPFSAIPIDPTNSAQDNLYYTYVTGGSWAVSAMLESNHEPILKQAIKDGDSQPGVFSLGTNLTLTPPTRDKGLVGFWRFEEGTGTSTADSSGKGNTGTLSNSPVWEAVANCKVGGCLSFNNGATNGLPDSSYARVVIDQDTTTYTVQEITVTAWSKPRNINASVEDVVIVTMDSWNAIGGFTLHFSTSSGGEMAFRTRNVGVPGDSYLSGVMGSDVYNWHFYAGVYKKPTDKLYVDGAEKVSATWNKDLPYQKIYRIGYWCCANRFLDGLIDEVRIYNRALSADEIAAIYGATK